jgi:hypothetical protein
MSKALINTLLIICQQQAEEYPAGKGFSAFCDEFGVGMKKGRLLVLSDRDRERIATILRNRFGVDPKTPADAWKSASREEALSLGADEKWTNQKVRDERVAIKSLPDKPLLLGSEQIRLPDGANLDMSWQDVARLSAHDSILVIENWTNFEKTHRTPLLMTTKGNPLVLYRGDPVYRNDHAMDLLKALSKPVIAFVDYDPKGLLIANSLPGFSEMLCPEQNELERLLDACKNEERYALQKAHIVRALDELVHPQLKGLNTLFDRYGVALPQEALIDL